jgi:hypothetical protein
MRPLQLFRGLLVLFACPIIVCPAVGQAVQAATTSDPPPVADGASIAEFGVGWKGVWEWHNEYRDCQTSFLLFQTTTRDTICVGDTYDPEGMEGALPLDCTGTIGDNEVHLECSGQVPVEDEPGCTADYSLVIDWMRTGDTISAEQTIEATFIGDCSLTDPYCLRVVMTGTRIDPDPNSCFGTPARNESWGALKSIYR